MKTYKLKGKVVLWPTENGAWHFIYIDKKTSKKIKASQKGKLRRGFGAVKVEVKVGKTKWKTSIFPDTKSESYVLPIKASVRKKEGVYEGDEVSFTLSCIKM